MALLMSVMGWFKRQFLAIPKYMDGLLAFSEALIVLCLVGGVLYATWRLFVSPATTIDAAIVRIERHWKGCLVIGIPLFYRTIRAMLLNIRKAGGVEFGEPQPETATDQQPRTNPVDPADQPELEAG